MNILAFETSHSEASVALCIENEVFEKRIVSQKKHEETVMPAVVALLDEHSISVSDLDLVAVDVGPGSFTGIRIGICHANAIADAVNIPCIGVCALEAMIYGVSYESAIGAMIEAGNDNCYGALFDNSHKYIMGPEATSIHDFLERISDMSCNSILKDTDGFLPSAGAISMLAKEKYSEIGYINTRALPLYLRPSQAERKRTT